MPRTSPRRLSLVNGLSGLRRGDGPRRLIRPAGALLLAAAWCALAAPFAAHAQNIQYTSKSADQGLRSDFKVNPSTHALELRIPLAGYPGRAGTGLPVALNYSSKVWRMKYATYFQTHSINGYAAVYGEHSQAGWTFSPGFPLIDTESQLEKYDGGGGPTGGACQAGGTSGTPSGTSSCCRIDRVQVRMPDGSTHELRSTDTPVCLVGPDGQTSITPPDDMYATDGSRLRYRKSTNELFLPDGSRYVFNGGAPGGRYIDRNGNVLSHDGTQWTDTLGRTVGPMPVGDGDYPYTLPGVGGSTLNYTLRWRHLSAAGVLSPGEPLSWTTSPSCPTAGSQTHADFLFGGGDGCIVSHSLHDPLVLHQVVLPTGQSYTFNYNRYGEVSKVTYPTGGYERFVYARADSAGWVNEPYMSLNRGVIDRYVSASGSGADEVRWQYPTGVGGAFVFNEFKQGEVATDGTLTERLMHRGGDGAGFGYSYGGAMGGMPYEERVWSAPDPADNNNRKLLRRRLTKWEATGPGTTYVHAQQAARNGRVTKEVEILLDTNGGPALAKVTTYEYNLAYEFTTGANLKAVNEYDFSTVAQSTARTAGVDSFSPPAQWLRRTEYDYLDDVNASYRGRSLLGLKQETRVKDSSGAVVARTVVGYDQNGLANCPDIVKHDAAYGTGFTTRGNMTSVTSYADAAGITGAVNTSTNYDEAGNAVGTTDANGNTSYVSYADNFSDSNNLRHTFAYPTSVTTPAPNPAAVPNPAGGSFPAGTFGSTTGFTASTVYDFGAGRVTSQTDSNNRTTTYDYTDPLNRLKAVTRPDGGTTACHYDRNQYGDYVRTMTALDASRSVTSYQFFDGLGRASRSFLSEGGAPEQYLTSDTQYDSSGRVRRVSNPYRSTGADQTVNPSGLWTTTGYDALGRVKSVTTPDGAVVTTAYSGLQVTVTDQAGRKRSSVSDGLGRLARVTEDPTTGGLNYLTTYTYDVLGNLRKVDQGGQYRFFMYDSLGRLTRAKNPEQAINASLAAADPVTQNGQWTFAYGYDAGGNLTSRTDARGVQTAYTYDRLNRHIIAHYAGGGTSTPDVRRYYDNAAAGVNGLGRPYWTEKVGVSANVFDRYDAAGRPTRYHQVYWTGNNWGLPFNVSLSYDKAGNVTSQTYPSGHAVNYNYDAAGRGGDNGTQLAFTGNLGDGVGRTYASQVTYGEFGGIKQERFGTATPLYHKLHYNRRGQLFDIRLSTQSLQTGEWDWNRGAVLNYYGGSYAWEGDPATPAGADNNGDLRRSEVYAPLDAAGSYSGVGAPAAYYTAQQTYAYDALNRLGSVTESNYNSQTGTQAAPFTQTYGYDRWGNRTIDAGQTTGAPEPQFELAPQTNQEVAEPSNRLYAPGDAGRAPAQKLMRYDAAGNLTHDAHTGAGGRVYDGENRMTAAYDSTGNWASYTYDADGRRVKRKTAGEEWWQVSGVGGELLAEYRAGAATYVPSKEYGYRGGELLVTMSSGDDRRLRRFVYNLYYGALRRDPTAQEFQDRTNELAAAGTQGQPPLLAKAKEIARALFTQTTYELSPSRTEGQYVSDLYYAYLQRAADDAGLAGWAAAAGGATNRSNVCDAFQESAEFAAVVSTLYGAAGSDDARTDAFVNKFYLGAYGRGASTAESQQWRSSLNAAAAQGAAAVQAAAESMGRQLFAAQVNDYSITDQQYVTNLYEGFLQRGPDASGLSFWTSNAAGGAQSRQNVLNAFATSPASRELSGMLYRETFWLVADRLGTPRMVADKTGSLAGIKRHDYLPFGEELSAGAGGRTPNQGYGAADNVRQKFTGYEHDEETKLDYAQARYYANVQGRFTSVDPLPSSAAPGQPQSWNRYTYALNNPLLIVDPTGLVWTYTTSNEGRTRSYAWYGDKNDVPAGATILEKPGDFYVEGKVDGYLVGIRFNPNGPKSSARQLLELDPGWNAIGEHDDYHEKGYEFVPTQEQRMQYMKTGAVEPDYAFQFAATGVFTAGLSAASTTSKAATHRALFGPSSGRYFFTDGLEAAARAAARAEGGGTLNMVPAGRAAMWLDGKVPDLLSRQIWRWESRQWAKGASGNVPFLSNGLPNNPVSSFVRDELPNLYRNPKVQSITPRAGP